MRRAITIVTLGLLLAGCETTLQKAQEIAELVKKNCGVIVSVADIAVALSVPHPAVTGAVAMAHAICSQAERTENGELEFVPMPEPYLVPRIIPVQIEQPEPPPLPTQKPPVVPEVVPEPLPLPLPPEEPITKDDCVAIVNSVCIRKEGEN